MIICPTNTASDQVSIYRELPQGFLDCKVTELAQLLGGPSLIFMPGRQSPPLYISTLLHGNEWSGFTAVQNLLRTYQQQQRQLPREIILFIGNVHAAAQNKRFLPGQTDYNRVWAGGNGPEEQMAEQVKAIIKQAGVIASVDLHNNTGFNPHYACINKPEVEFINLASLFSREIVYFTEPSTVHSVNFAKICPSVTIEAGLSGSQASYEHVHQFLDACLHMQSLQQSAFKHSNLDIYHTVARVHVPKDASLSFNGKNLQADFSFSSKFDHFNFTPLPPHARIGWHNGNKKLIMIDNHGNDVNHLYINYDNNQMRLKRKVIPSMLTKDIRVIHQDCLGYLMESYVI